MLAVYGFAVEAHPSRIRNADALVPWNRLLAALKTEWVLLAEKTAAAMASFAGETGPSRERSREAPEAESRCGKP